MRIIVVTPVFNDWESLTRLLRELGKISATGEVAIQRVVVVNDCSIAPAPPLSGTPPITLVDLATNLGHQRAIAVGLAYVNDQLANFDAVVVMDSDGEDDPAYLKGFAEALRSAADPAIVFAERRKRAEGLGFRIGYRLYRLAFQTLTGQHIAFGNFCAIPSALLDRVVRIPGLWNHFSSSILHSRIPYQTIATDRRSRYAGQSQMRLSGLVIHGMSAIATYLDVVVVRMLLLTGVAACGILLLLMAIVAIRLFTDLAIPGWASTVSLALLNFAGLFFVVALLLLMLHLNQRSAAQLPITGFYREMILSTADLQGADHANPN
jgi:hypothetical protein